MSKDKSRKKKKEKMEKLEKGKKLSKKFQLELADSRYEELKLHFVGSYNLFGKYLLRLEELMNNEEFSKAERMISNLKVLLNVEKVNVQSKQ